MFIISFINFFCVTTDSSIDTAQAQRKFSNAKTSSSKWDSLWLNIAITKKVVLSHVPEWIIFATVAVFVSSTNNLNTAVRKTILMMLKDKKRQNWILFRNSQHWFRNGQNPLNLIGLIGCTYVFWWKIMNSSCRRKFKFNSFSISRFIWSQYPINFSSYSLVNISY